MKKKIENGFIVYTENNIKYLKDVEILNMRGYLVFRSLFSNIEISIPKDEIHQVQRFNKREAI